MSIQLIRFNGMNVTPKDDAILYEKALPINGIFYGCDLTFMGANKVHLAAGRGIYKGRDFTIEEQDLNVELSSSGEKSGRIYIRIDLSNAIEPISIRSITASTLPALIDDENFNTELGIGELELATYTAEELKINNLKETFAYVGKGLKDELNKLDSNLTALSNSAMKFSVVNNQIDTVKTGGFYYIQSTSSTPTKTNGYLIVIPYANISFCCQLFIPFNAAKLYIRVLTSTGWGSWSY